ncbi:MAG: integrase [Micropruina glycogenica]
MASRRDVTKKFAREYAKADRAEKSRILDALVASTGWTRDHARRAIRAAATRKGAARDQQRKPRPRKYSYDALIVLQEVWRLAGQPSGKYLAVVMEDTLCRLVRDRELGKVADRVSDTVIDELRSMSAATIDRYLKPHKAAGYPAAGLSSTRPSHILRSSIPLRTATDDPITVPGFLELDTVAHCGHTLKGEFLRTLSATDPVTGWTMLRSIRNNAFVHVHAGLEWIAKLAPLPIAGMDFDNGSEFMNWSVIAWCDDHHIPITRGRPYHHNDNAHIEQRNGDWVRRHAFRYRYETDDAELDLSTSSGTCHGPQEPPALRQPSTGPDPQRLQEACLRQTQNPYQRLDTATPSDTTPPEPDSPPKLPTCSTSPASPAASTTSSNNSSTSPKHAPFAPDPPPPTIRTFQVRHAST